MPNKTVNVGLHLEILKFGSAPDPTKPTLEDNVKGSAIVASARKNYITRVGVDLSYAENRALFAVQKLLDETGYRGNTRPLKLPHGNPYHSKESVPILNIKIAEYLAAYGVRKTRTARGKNEYSAQGRRSALAALESLAKKKCLLVYKREQYHESQKGRKDSTDLIEVVDNLITVKKAGGQLMIELSPILSDQHDTYYMSVPADLYTEVLTDRQKSKVLFIEYLFYHHEMQRRPGGTSAYLVTRQMETIAYAIGLGSLIETRQTKKLRAVLKEYYESAKQQGYLRKYEVDVKGARYETVDKLYINASTMAKLRKV